jgi:hypothetical protein
MPPWDTYVLVAVQLEIPDAAHTHPGLKWEPGVVCTPTLAVECVATLSYCPNAYIVPFRLAGIPVRHYGGYVPIAARKIAE